MMFKCLTLAILLGVTCAEPLRKYSVNNEVMYSGYPSYEVVSQTENSFKPDLILSVLSTLVSYKSSALSLAVSIIEWMMSNVFIMAIGATAVIGYCKLIGCDFKYEQYIPVSEIQTYATPENIQTAEKFLFKAFEQYAEKKKREV